MPSLTFVLPHWLYWGTLIVFPLIAIYFVRRQVRQGAPASVSLFVAYVFWLCAGFVGLHRFYLRSLWGLVFIPVFLAILYTNAEIRDRREDVSRTRAAIESAHHEVTRAQIPSGTTATPAMTERLTRAQTEETSARTAFDAAAGNLGDWQRYARWLAYLMAAMLVADAILLPFAVKRTRAREARERRPPPVAEVPDVPAIGTHEDPTIGMHTRFTDLIEKLNVRVGEFVAYWAVISVFGYYYEVIARYVFNSPTNWLHESMFLMYGMQYIIAGAYAYHTDQHVRVDVFYSKFSPRGKALADIVTSLFFFIFVGTLLWTGWVFARDSFNPGGLGEVSFTEWGVQYWPVKLMMPIGAALLLLQGLARLLKDIVFLSRGRA